VYIAGASADGGKNDWNRIIAGVSPSGGTNLYAGLETGIEQLSGLSGDAIDRVVVLSDGMANIGVTDPASLRALAASQSSQGITVSTIGLGLDFNEDLLAAMSDAGGGSYAFVDRPGELSEILDGELTAMTTIAGRNARLDVSVAPGVEILETYAESAETHEGGFTVFLGDVHAGEHRKIVARVRIPAGEVGTRGVSTAELHYDRPSGGPTLALDASASAQVTADLVQVERSVDPTTSEQVLRAVSGRGLQRAARAYGEGRDEDGRQALDAGRSALETLGRRYATPAATPLISELDDKASAFRAAPRASDDGLYLVKKTKEEARELSNH
jgi:Ca-activated chloride channel homolog